MISYRCTITSTNRWSIGPKIRQTYKVISNKQKHFYLYTISIIRATKFFDYMISLKLTLSLEIQLFIDDLLLFRYLLHIIREGRNLYSISIWIWIWFTTAKLYIYKIQLIIADSKWKTHKINYKKLIAN